MLELHRPSVANRVPLRPDAVIQSAPGPAVSTSAGLNFEGVGTGFTGPQGTFTPAVAPSDSNLAVGDTQVVQWVNLDFAVFDKKTGNVVYGPVPGNTIWQGSGSVCETTNDGDPIVLYDHTANRWIFAQLSFSLGPPYYECVAISTSSDATGSYSRYVYEAPNGGMDFPDYTKLGLWSDAYYMTANLFTNATTYNGVAACALDRAAMLAGNAQPAIICFTPGTIYFGLLPADLDGTTPPSAGSPGIFMSLGDDNASLLLWRLHADFTTPASSTFSGPATIPVTAFTPACSQSPTNTCIPQPNLAGQLDSLGDRLMYRLSYRNFGDHESLIASHSVTAGNTVGIRWYEVRDPYGTNPNIYQQSTYAPADSLFRWMGSIGMDKAGNIALGFSFANNTVFPSVGYTGRTVSDPLNTMSGDVVIIAGGGSQNNDRWGDYSSMSIDPVDDCTFWYTDEYMKSNGNLWNTRIASFSFPGCTAPAAPDFSVAVTPLSQSVSVGGSTSYTVTIVPSNGFNDSVSLNIGSLPAGVIGTFSPTSVTGAGSSTLAVTTAGNTPLGTFSVAITATSGSLQHSQNVTLRVSGAISLSPSPLAFAAQALGNQSAALPVTLTNGGVSSLSMGTFLASGDFAPVPAAPTTCIGTVPAGAQCLIYVTFTPKATGSRSGLLTIRDSDPSSPQTVVLTGTGIGAFVSPSSKTFSVQRVFTTSGSKSVKLTNVAKTSFRIQAPTLSGTNPADFLVAPAVTSGCGTSLAAGASCYYKVRFRPTDKNVRTAVLNLNDDWGSQPVALSGTGTIVKLSSTSVSFGAIAVGVIAHKTVTVTNTSTVYALQFSGLAISGSNPSYFKATGCIGSLVPGASCTVTISFKPTSTSSRSATLNINDDGGGSPQQVKLSGS